MYPVTFNVLASPSIDQREVAEICRPGLRCLPSNCVRQNHWQRGNEHSGIGSPGSRIVNMSDYTDCHPPGSIPALLLVATDRMEWCVLVTCDLLPGSLILAPSTCTRNTDAILERC